LLRINPIFIDNVISNKIDRTFVDQDGTRWIIDYKTSRHEEEDADAFLDQQQEHYREQMEKYGALMQLHWTNSFVFPRRFQAKYTFFKHIVLQHDVS